MEGEGRLCPPVELRVGNDETGVDALRCAVNVEDVGSEEVGPEVELAGIGAGRARLGIQDAFGEENIAGIRSAEAGCGAVSLAGVGCAKLGGEIACWEDLLAGRLMEEAA